MSIPIIMRYSQTVAQVSVRHILCFLLSCTLVTIAINTPANEVVPTLESLDLLRAKAEVDPIEALRDWQQLSPDESTQSEYVAIGLYLYRTLDKSKELKQLIADQTALNFTDFQLIEYYFAQAFLALNDNRLSDSNNWLSKAENIANETGNLKFLAQVYANQAINYTYQNKPQAARETAFRSIELSSDIDHELTKTLVHTAMSQVYQEAGDSGNAERYALMAIDYAMKAGNQHITSVSYYNLAIIYEFDQKLKDALQAYINSLTAARQAGDEISIAYAQYGIALTEANLGNDQAALESMLTAINKIDITQNKEMSLTARLEAIDIAERAKKTETVRSLLNELKGFEDDLDGYLYLKRHYLKQEALWHKSRGDQDKALYFYDQLLKVLQNEMEQYFKELDNKRQRELNNKNLTLELNVLQDEFRTLSNRHDTLLTSQQQAKQYFYISLTAMFILTLLSVIIFTKYWKIKYHLQIDECSLLPNKVALQVKLNQITREFRRTGHIFSLARLEIPALDNIDKKVDKETAEKAIFEVSRMLTNALQAGDFIAIEEGGIFTVLLPKTNELDAIKRLETIKESIEGRAVYGFTEPAQISIGYTRIADSDLSFKQTLSRADFALESAKKKGFNRLDYRQV